MNQIMGFLYRNAMYAKVNICAVFSLVLPLALEQGKKNQYCLLFVYLLKTPKRLFLAVKMEKGVSQKITNNEIDKGAEGVE